MRIYNDYLSTIEEAIKADPNTINLSESYNQRNFPKGLTYEELNKRIPKNQLQPALKILSAELGLQPNFNQRPGQHPDFAHLKLTNSVENHYIVSMFVDIKGS